MNSDQPPAEQTTDFSQRLRYHFDRLLARGTWATLLWLGIVTLAVVATSAVALALFDVTFTSDEDVSFFEDFWQSLLRVLDPGTMAGDVGWGRRFLALAVTLFGLLVAGTLIGIIAAGVEERIDRMRSGRSVVFESGHVVVLGASDRLPTLVRQLILANRGRRGDAIVVMSEGEAVEMQDRVRRVVTDEGDSRLVFRSGDPTYPPDLEMVRISEARTVIILSAGDPGDSIAIRTVVAVDSVLGGFEDVPTVVELSEPASVDQLARVYPIGLHPIVLWQGIARIAAEALREPGVGQVAISLLDDRGSDVHITRVPSLEDRPFSEIRNSFTNARPIGYMGSDGSVLLNPPPQARMEPGSRLVLVSESEHVAPDSSLPSVTVDTPDGDPRRAHFEQREQHILVLGWSPLGAMLLTDWTESAPTTSTVEVMLDPAIFDGVGLVEGMVDATVQVKMAADFEVVASRLEDSPPIDTILILGSAGELGEDQADSRTLLSLVGLRRILKSMSRPAPRVLVEILDVDNASLVALATRDDLVISDAIGSQLIAQLAEMPERRNVFLHLYKRVGPSLHLIPAHALGLIGSIHAAEMYQTAYRAGVLAIGTRNLNGELALNPSPTQKIELSMGDQVVVIG